MSKSCQRRDMTSPKKTTKVWIGFAYNRTVAWWLLLLLRDCVLRIYLYLPWPTDDCRRTKLRSNLKEDSWMTTSKILKKIPIKSRLQSDTIKTDMM